jgi:hypothetical protein
MQASGVANDYSILTKIFCASYCVNKFCVNKFLQAEIPRVNSSGNSASMKCYCLLFIGNKYRADVDRRALMIKRDVVIHTE